MFDYIEISKYLPDGVYLTHTVEQNELTIGHNPLKIYYNNQTQYITIKGSIPYFYLGHNFYFTLNDARRAIVVIEECLNIRLNDANVKILEYGAVIMPPFNIDRFIDNHLSTRGYRTERFENKGMNYVRKDKGYKLKFYSMWANIDSTKNKITSDVRLILKSSKYNKSSNAMRFEIHGNPQKILGCKSKTVSEVFTEAFEIECKKKLLSEYRKIKKQERLRIKNTKDKSSLKFALSLLSEKWKGYQKDLLDMVDDSNLDYQSKVKRKMYFRKKFREIPHEKSSYSIEKLLIETLGLE